MLSAGKADIKFGKHIQALLVLPGIVALLIPTLLGLVDAWRGSGYGLGTVLLVIGLIALLRCAWDFWRFGQGTVAPWAPPRRLVTAGLYRHTRNPIYIALLLIIGGLAMLWGSPLIATYWLVALVGFHLRVLFVEEVRLASRFGDAWQAYSREVPRWYPRLRPWRSAQSSAESPPDPDQLAE